MYGYVRIDRRFKMEQPVARTPRPSMLTVDEVAERLKIKKGSAYEVIRQMNKE